MCRQDVVCALLRIQTRESLTHAEQCVPPGPLVGAVAARGARRPRLCSGARGVGGWLHLGRLTWPWKLVLRSQAWGGSSRRLCGAWTPGGPPARTVEN